MTKKPSKPMTKDAAKRIERAAGKDPNSKTSQNKFVDRATKAAIKNQK